MLHEFVLLHRAQHTFSMRGMLSAMKAGHVTHKLSTGLALTGDDVYDWEASGIPEAYITYKYVNTRRVQDFMIMQVCGIPLLWSAPHNRIRVFCSCPVSSGSVTFRVSAVYICMFFKVLIFNTINA